MSKFLDKTGLSTLWAKIKTYFAKKEDVYTKTEVDNKVERTNLINTIGEATASLSGIMSVQDKNRLDTLVALLSNDDSNSIVDTITEVLEIFNQYPEGADLVSALGEKANKTDIPTKVSQLTNDSGYLTQHQDLSAYALKTELFSKDYNDLTNKPTIPSKTSQLTNDSDFATTDQLFSGDYSDLENAPEEAVIVVRDYISDLNGQEARELELNGQYWNFPSGKLKLVDSGAYQGEQESGTYFSFRLGSLLDVNNKVYIVRLEYPEHGGTTSCVLHSGYCPCVLISYETDQELFGTILYAEQYYLGDLTGVLMFLNRTNQEEIYSECTYEIFELPFSL